ncbi:hypothetical protein BOX15_Mlig018067g1, partial [Macrostomum lignano]
IEELCSRRDLLQKEIDKEEAEKTKLQRDLKLLSDELAKVNESLSKKLAHRAQYDRTIAETEAAYSKILESSQTLLTLVKREGQALGPAAAAGGAAGGNSRANRD